jgi:hypothetical protein
MTIDERIRAIAKRRVDKMKTFCAAKKAQQKALEDLCFKLLKGEYLDIPDEYKDSWLNDQEAT